MNHPVVRRILIAFVLAPAILAAGCAAPDAPGIRGRWKPVNGYAEAPQAIPLQPTYLFQSSPTDGTLKSMLSRWAKDSRMSLSYLHANDYTLYSAVADIHTTSVQDAVAQVANAYAAEGVSITVDGSQIVVRAAAAEAASPDDAEE